MARVVVRISGPNEAVVRYVVPFFARHFARFATDAHAWISEKADLNVFLHIIVPTLVRALRALADHRICGRARVRAGEAFPGAPCFSRENFGRPGGPPLPFRCTLILFLLSRGRRRLCLRRPAVLRDAK